ncbi:MAG: hypothetical protein AAGF50_04045 [Pseudomonadota bacterium]
MSAQMKWTITLLMTTTVLRAQTILFLPSVEAFGGAAANAWFAPWLSDAIIGLLVPVMIYVLWKARTPTGWGALLIYNSLGAFDYSHGMLTQYFYPMPGEMASPITVYLGIGVFMVLQLIAIWLLLRRNVVAHFYGSKP